jgi:hypothetical protein
MLGRVDAGRPDVTLTLLRDLRGFRDDQPGGGALGVVPGVEVGRRAGRVIRAIAGQRRHHGAIGKLHGAELKGLKQRVVLRRHHIPHISTWIT